MKIYYVYMMASRSRALYVGMTANLPKRVNQHKQKVTGGHTGKYRIDRLVYFESYSQVLDAINRETQIKSWRRSKKERLIESVNPEWKELEIPAEGIFFVRA